MKITVETSLLEREFYKIQGIVSAKSSMMILSNALLVATEDGELSIHATDLEIALNSTIPARVERAGRITLRARDFYDVLKGLKSDTVTLEADGTHAVDLTSGTAKARMVALNPDEYPGKTERDEEAFVEVSTERLIRMINRVVFAIATDDGRPNLTGALLSRTDDGRLQLVATDGHRLSRVTSEIENADQLPESFNDGIIVPKKGWSELQRALDKTIESVGIAVSNKDIVFRFGNTTLSVRAIDGRFPNVAHVLPEEHEDRKAVLHRSTLLDRLKLVSNFANARTHSVRLEFDDGNCRISAQDADTGEISEEIPIAFTAPAVKAGFNFRYLQELLGKLESDEVSIEVTDTLQPTVVHELEVEEGEESIFILMPMRI